MIWNGIFTIAKWVVHCNCVQIWYDNVYSESSGIDQQQYKETFCFKYSSQSSTSVIFATNLEYQTIKIANTAYIPMNIDSL